MSDQDYPILHGEATVSFNNTMSDDQDDVGSKTSSNSVCPQSKTSSDPDQMLAYPQPKTSPNPTMENGVCRCMEEKHNRVVDMDLQTLEVKEKIKAIAEIIPDYDESDESVILDDAINYMKSLQSWSIIYNQCLQIHETNNSAMLRYSQVMMNTQDYQARRMIMDNMFRVNYTASLTRGIVPMMQSQMHAPDIYHDSGMIFRSMEMAEDLNQLTHDFLSRLQQFQDKHFYY